ncbi:MAG: sel1 repeat family protein [Candidatus Methanomethylophilaceae archaeon]|nr:sel1 repeat family protein [Candidatus Methanomethylophilaceae archaeon]
MREVIKKEDGTLEFRYGSPMRKSIVDWCRDNSHYNITANRMDRLFQDGLVLPESDEDVVRFLSDSGTPGYPDTLALLGNVYKDGVGTNTNFVTAAEYFAKGADEGCGDACGALSEMYYVGQGVPKDKEKSDDLVDMAEEIFEREGNNGDMWAVKALADSYYSRHGLFCVTYWEESAKANMIAAEGGIGGAAYSLGWQYEHEQGVPENLDMALRYYSLADELGYPIAKECVERLSKKLGKTGGSSE